MRKIVGGFFTVVGYIAIAAFGLWGLVIELAIIEHVAGFWGMVVGFMILPLMLTVTPLYALIAWGNWFPLLIVYGGGIFAFTMIGVGGLIKGDD